MLVYITYKDEKVAKSINVGMNVGMNVGINDKIKITNTDEEVIKSIMVI